jgi:hypothetical protein
LPRGQAGPTDAEIQDWMAFDKEVRDADAFVNEAGFHAAGAGRTVSVGTAPRA